MTDENTSAVSASVARQAGRGLRWSLAATIATKAGSFAMGLVLARLLTPDDFGVYAIALAGTGFLMHVNDVGLMAAVVQWRGRLEDVAPTASVVALAFSLVVYGAFWIGAPAFADLAGSPGTVPVLRLLALVIVIDGITAIRVASLQRTFQQQKIAVANTVGFVVQAPVAILLAATGGGAEAFVWGQLAQALVTGVLVFWWARLPFLLTFNGAVARTLLRYGIPLAASLGVEALLINADYVVVGRLLGATLLGFYLLAFNVSSWVANTLGTAIRYVSVAGFSRLAEQDGALSAGLRRSLQVLLTLVLPVVTIMAVLAGPLIAFLYGDPWAPAADALAFLMILALFRLLIGLGLDVLMATAATRSALVVNCTWALVLVPALVTGTTLGGIRGTAVAHVLTALLIAVPASAVALRRVGVQLAPIARDAVRPIGAALATATAVWLVAEAVGPRPLAQLLIAGPAGLVVYLATALTRDQQQAGAERVLRLLPRNKTTDSPS